MNESANSNANSSIREVSPTPQGATLQGAITQGEAFSTTDLDLASWLDYLGWETVRVESASEYGKHKRFLMRPPVDAQTEARHDIQSFDRPAEVVPSELYAARSRTVKRMHRMSS